MYLIAFDITPDMLKQYSVLMKNDGEIGELIEPEPDVVLLPGQVNRGMLSNMMWEDGFWTAENLYHFKTKYL
ncbi:MAG: hypothetical protein LBB86_06030 [Oscillospiraceae bacterium]|jgi:hypothetical protein|nr:hypothetical protein [Oscillospiraceae bacterium]